MRQDLKNVLQPYGVRKKCKKNYETHYQEVVRKKSKNAARMQDLFALPSSPLLSLLQYKCMISEYVFALFSVHHLYPLQPLCNQQNQGEGVGGGD